MYVNFWWTYSDLIAAKRRVTRKRKRAELVEAFRANTGTACDAPNDIGECG